MTTPQEQGTRRGGRPPKAHAAPEANLAQTPQPQGDPGLVVGSEHEQQGDQGNERSAVPGQGDVSTVNIPPTGGEQGPDTEQGSADPTQSVADPLVPPVVDPVVDGDGSAVVAPERDPLVIKVSNSGHTVLEMRSKVSLTANQVTTIPAKNARDRILILKNIEQLNHLSGKRNLAVVED
jgi:hypothetical protein